MENNALLILNLLYNSDQDPEYCSPNFVADFAYNRGFELTSDEVVYISDVYGTVDCPTGIVIELDESEPDYECDAFLTSTGPLGSRTTLSIEGRVIGEYTEHSEAINAFKLYCETSSYWPNLWSVSDHGNVHIVNLNEEE